MDAKFEPGLRCGVNCLKKRDEKQRRIFFNAYLLHIFAVKAVNCCELSIATAFSPH